MTRQTDDGLSPGTAEMRIAVVASQSWFTRKDFGGAEKQIYNLAKALVDLGHHVDVFSLDTDRIQESEGIRILPGWDLGRGIPKLRYITYRVPSLLSRLRAGGYHAVYCRGFADHAIPISMFRKYHGAKSIIALASNANVSWPLWKLTLGGRSRLRRIQEWFKHCVFRRVALRKADLVLAQNEFQLREAEKYSGMVRLLPSIYAAPGDVKPYEKDFDLVWIGGLRPAKGIDELLEIIRGLPDLSFCVVGSAAGREQEHFEGVFKAISNVSYFPSLTNEAVHGILMSSRLLLNTSFYEGFPNTYLEAWYCCTPVVSMHADPDGLLERKGLGYCSHGDRVKLREAVRMYLSDPKRLRETGARAHRYVLENHGTQKVTGELIGLIAEISGRTGGWAAVDAASPGQDGNTGSSEKDGA